MNRFTRWWHGSCPWQPSCCQGSSQGSAPVSPHGSPPSLPPVTPFPTPQRQAVIIANSSLTFLPCSPAVALSLFFLHSSSEICSFLGVRPLHQHPPPVSPSLLSLVSAGFFFFFGFSPSLTLCFASSLSICLPLSVHACAALTPGPSESQCTFLSVGLFLSGWLWVFVFISPPSPNRSQPETPWGSRV